MPILLQQATAKGHWKKRCYMSSAIWSWHIYVELHIEVPKLEHCFSVESVNQNKPGQEFQTRNTLGFPNPRKGRMYSLRSENMSIKFPGIILLGAPDETPLISTFKIISICNIPDFFRMLEGLKMWISKFLWQCCNFIHISKNSTLPNS